MAKQIGLVHIGRDTFLMLNPTETITNRQCNSMIFEKQEDASLDVSVFDHFDVKVNIIIEKLDRRTKRFKALERDTQYFSAAYLPKIKARQEGNSTMRYVYSKKDLDKLMGK